MVKASRYCLEVAVGFQTFERLILLLLSPAGLAVVLEGVGWGYCLAKHCCDVALCIICEPRVLWLVTDCPTSLTRC